MDNFEFWDIGCSEVCMYTEEKSVVQEMTKQFSRRADYFKSGKKIGCHFLVPKRIVRILKRRHEKSMDCNGYPELDSENK